MTTTKKEDKHETKTIHDSKAPKVDLPDAVASALALSKPPDLAAVVGLYAQTKEAGKRFHGRPLGSKEANRYHGFCVRFSSRLRSPAPWGADELAYWQNDFDLSTK